LPARWTDPESARGNLPDGQPIFASAGFSDFVVERGLPYSRSYDPLAELERIRRIFAVQAALPVRRAAANTFHHPRHLRRS
jgi:hypothetical protein